MNIYEKLQTIQQELKAPKSQYTEYGNYYYRNAENILEAVKPLCEKVKATLKIELVNAGYEFFNGSNDSTTPFDNDV